MNRIKLFFGVAALAFSLSSCEAFLEEEPISEIPVEEMWQTSRDVKAGVNEIY